MFGRYQRSRSSLTRERWAWDWARRHALIWTPATERTAAACLAWYGARERSWPPIPDYDCQPLGYELDFLEHPAEARLAGGPSPGEGDRPGPGDPAQRACRRLAGRQMPSHNGGYRIGTSDRNGGMTGFPNWVARAVGRPVDLGTIVPRSPPMRARGRSPDNCPLQGLTCGRGPMADPSQMCRVASPARGRW